jgi:hypothetical protein
MMDARVLEKFYTSRKGVFWQDGTIIWRGGLGAAGNRS